MAQSVRKKKHRQLLFRERLFLGGNYVFFFLFTLLCAYPFYYVIIYSLSDATLANVYGVWFVPRGFSTAAYARIFRQGDIPQAFLVSFVRVISGTMISTMCTSALAYLLTKREMLFHRFVYRFFIITMYVGGGLIPGYLTYKAYGLLNTFWVYIIPGAIGIWNMILVKTFMEQLPESLEEAAVIEGAGIFTAFFRITLPLCKPVVATIATYNAVGHWNNWTDNFYFVQSKNLQTLQLIMNNYIRAAEKIAASMQNSQASMENMQNLITPKSIQMAVIVISVVPIMLVYPLAQKYFAKGIMLGAIKG